MYIVMKIYTYTHVYELAILIFLLFKRPFHLIYPEITDKSEKRANAAGSSENEIDIDGATCDEWPRSRAYQLQFLSPTRFGRTSGAPLPAHTRTSTHTNTHTHTSTLTSALTLSAHRSGQRRSKTHRAGNVCCLLSAVQLQLQQR